MQSTSRLVDAARQGDALTYNGAVTHSTSLNSIVDLFFIAGASRTMSTEDIERMLTKSWVEDPLLTMKVIFWAGNIRGGAGERRFFRTALSWLEKDSTRVKTLQKNIHLVPKFNRWDSLFHLEFGLISDEIINGLEKKDGLLAKWLPRKSQHQNLAYAVAKSLGLSPKQYRKLIVGLSKTVEQQMCKKQWSKINYSHVPSIAMHKYRTAFGRNDETRFTQFITKVEKGEEKINASTIFPYQLYDAIRQGQDPKVVEAQWNAMPNWMEGNTERILPVCDVSGSMLGLPMSISVSLGLYLSERNKGLFQDAFITFSESPEMVYLKGSLENRMNQLEKSHWGMNTNLQAVFWLILDSAVKNNLKQSEMPTMILIISDMEFDSCCMNTNYNAIEVEYQSAGYKPPKIVFWNVNGRAGNVPVNSKQKNVGLVSGATPAVIKGVLSGKTCTPVDIMLETLNNEMYDCITI